MEIAESAVLSIRDNADIGEARRRGALLATRLAFDSVEAGRLALVITEAAKNILHHAKFGELFLSSISEPGDDAIDVVAVDQGPGMSDPNRCFEDGFSTAGTPGTGLGAIRRLSDSFSLFTAPGKGTALLCRVGRNGPSSGTVTAGLSRPYPGEVTCGDSWSVARYGPRTSLLVADGLGHGPKAAEAARLAALVHRESVGERPLEIVQRIHGALRATRGAAVAVADVNEERREIAFAGIGNISAVVIAERPHSLVSHSGIAGGEVRRFQEFVQPWPAGAALVLHSDGITSRWSLGAYPGLQRMSPALIAAILLRDFTRGTDDATALVHRSHAGGGA